MSDIEKLKRHLSKPIPITIKNLDGAEDVFYLKPLNVEQQAINAEIFKSIQDREEIEIEFEEDGKKKKMKIPDVTKEDLKELELLLIDVVKNSIEGIDDALAKDFVNTNFEQLMDKLKDLQPKSSSNKDLKLLKKAKERIEIGQQTKTSENTK